MENININHYKIELGDIVEFDVRGDFGSGAVVQMEYLSDEQVEQIKNIMGYDKDFKFEGLVLVK